MFSAMSSLFCHVVHFIFVLMIVGVLTTVVQSSTIFDNNATDPELQWQTDLHSIPKVRSRRDLFARMPAQLKLDIPIATVGVMQLRWKKYESHLANVHLPIIMSSGESKPNVMKTIGEFMVYSDLDKCSTVVYFENLHTLTGFIGSEYSILNLPYDFDENGNYLREIDQSLIIRVQNTFCHDNPQPSSSMQQTSDSQQTVEASSDQDYRPPTKVRRVKRSVDADRQPEVTNMNQSEIGNFRIRRAPTIQLYHLEILIFITRDIALEFQKLYAGNDQYIEVMVRDFIIYFNAVDMIFQKFGGYKSTMQINIAKIVIEDDTKPLDFIGSDELNFSETVTKLREYLSQHQNQYPKDSFDHVFISTNRVIKSGSTVILGKTTVSEDIYSARDNGQPYNAVSMTVLGYINDYIMAAHEIGHILNSQSDVLPVPLIRENHCSSIVQIGGGYNCLKWSKESQTKYRTFFRENRNRCFLINFPRSLRPPGPSRLVTPSKQCRCFGSTSYKYKCTSKEHVIVGYSECSLPLRCEKKVNGQSNFEYHIPPFDGTSCGFGHYCWNGKCT